jgi:hypothetical protein
MLKDTARLGLALCSALLLAACRADGPTTSGSLATVFPAANVVAGWTPTEDPLTFDRENIFSLVDGMADSYFVYGFEQVAVQYYKNPAGAIVGIEVWQLGTQADAYGLFTISLAGDSADIGNDGDTDPGRRLAFWQDRYYVRVGARQSLDHAVLVGFAEAISAALPTGGKRPAIESLLPTEGLIERSVIFFHEEISIQNDVWLGGENVLSLGPETDGVLAQYNVDGTTSRLMLIEYPDTESARAGLAALGRSAEIDNLVAANVDGDLLGAVFGEVNEGTATELLTKALSADGQ